MKKKQQLYVKPCREAHKGFLVDGIERMEARAARKQLASQIASKWGRNYAQVCWLVSTVDSSINFTI